MKLTKKSDKPVQQYKKMNLSESQKALYKTLWDSLMPYGKFVGRTAKWVYDNERWYWTYLEDNQILYDWNIKVLRGSAMEPKAAKGYSGTGEIWLELRVIEKNCAPTPCTWLE